MSQKLTAVLEGYKKGKWEIVEPFTINRSYNFNQLDRLIAQLAPIQAQCHQLFDGKLDYDPLENLEEFVELDDKKTPLERQLEIFTYKPPVELTDAFESTGSGYELQAILGVYGNTSIRSCEELSVVKNYEGLPSDCSELIERFLQWFALLDKSVFENVNTLSASMSSFAPHHLDVRDFLKFDWQKKIKRYCYVTADILNDFGNGEKFFTMQNLMKYYEKKKILFAAACYQPEFIRTTYYSSHMDSVGGEQFENRLKELNKNYNLYQKQRIIYWVYW